MKYYSETLNKFYESEKDCTEAEKAYKEELEAKKAKEKELAEGRKARAKEVEEAIEMLKSARKHYEKVLAEFCKDYGAFHMSVDKSDSDDFFGLFDLFRW